MISGTLSPETEDYEDMYSFQDYSAPEVLRIQHNTFNQRFQVILQAPAPYDDFGYDDNYSSSSANSSKNSTGRAPTAV